MSPQAPVYDSNNNAHSTRDLYQVLAVQGKGLGLIASRNIKVGEEILSEPCLLSIKHHSMMKERVARLRLGWEELIMPGLETIVYLSTILVSVIANYYLAAGAFILILIYRMFHGDKLDNICSIMSSVSLLLTKQQIAQQFNNLENSAQESILSLSNAFTYKSPDFVEKMLGILSTNSFQLREEGWGPMGQVVSGVFPGAARINHSCHSNCDYRLYLSLSGQWWISVVAIRPVSPETEITLCYNNFLESEGPVIKKERREYLQWAYRFRCCCEDCSLVGVESKSNDMMRSRVVRSRHEWTLTSELAVERRLVREQVRLLSLLHCAGRLEYMLQACSCGWDSEMEHSDQDMVTQTGNEQHRILTWLAQLGRQYSSTLHGQDSLQANIWQQRNRRLVKKPQEIGQF